jgi:hypothetical protein
MLFIEVETYRGLTGGTDAMNAFLAYAAGTWGKAAFQAVPADVLQGVTEAADGFRSKTSSPSPWKRSGAASLARAAASPI